MGSLPHGMVEAVRLYRDADDDKRFSDADFLVASAPVGQDEALFSFSPPILVGSSPEGYFLRVAVRLDAAPGDTLGWAIQDASHFGVGRPDIASPRPLPFQTPLAAVRDAKTPTQPVVTFPEGRFSSRSDSIHFSWSSQLAASPQASSMTIISGRQAPQELGRIETAEYAVGTTPGGAEVAPFTPLGASLRDVVVSGLRLASGTTYYVSVRSASSLGRRSSPGVSSPLFVDFVPPTKPKPVASEGQASSQVRWAPALAGPSGIKGYIVEYRRGDSPAWLNVRTRQPAKTRFARRSQPGASVASLPAAPPRMAVAPRVMSAQEDYWEFEDKSE